MKASRREFIRGLANAGAVLVGGNHPSIARADHALAQAVTPRRSPPIPPAPPAILTRIPTPGTFAEFTLNTPADVGADNAIFANWCGGTFVHDCGAMGAVAYHGGGEHFSGPDKGGVLLLDCATRRYVMRCLSSATTHKEAMWSSNGTVLGTPTNKWGAYADNDYPQRKHTYSCLSYQPAAWGGAPQGALMRVAHTGGIDSALGFDGYSSTYRFDLLQATDGHSRITGEQKYDFGNTPEGARVHDAIFACIDSKREGWWAFSRTSSTVKHLAFTHRSGLVTNFAAPGLPLARWAKLHHFEDDDLLCAMCDEPSFGTTLFGVVKLMDLNESPLRWVSITPTRPKDPELLWQGPGSIQCGYCGPQWSSLLGAFVCIGRRPDQLRIWKLTPPLPTQRFAGTWAWSVETVTSADGSTVNCYTDPANVNGSFGKLVECRPLRSLVWTRGVAHKGILIRLADMI